MKGDFTRETFRPERHYWGVLRQQGRDDLDADWNEQIRIARHQLVTRTADVVGAAGGPIGNAGFELTVDGAGDVTAGAGRYYVAGMLLENEVDVALASQPDDPGEAAPASAGFHLGYLDVWDRHVTALDDPPVRETALGGPDTAARARSVAGAHAAARRRHACVHRGRRGARCGAGRCGRRSGGGGAANAP